VQLKSYRSQWPSSWPTAPGCYALLPFNCKIIFYKRKAKEPTKELEGPCHTGDRDETLSSNAMY
jgi:hypothetical protein